MRSILHVALEAGECAAGAIVAGCLRWNCRFSWLN